MERERKSMQKRKDGKKETGIEMCVERRDGWREKKYAERKKDGKRERGELCKDDGKREREKYM